MNEIIKSLVAGLLIIVTIAATFIVTLFVVGFTGLEVHTYEKNAINNIAIPLHAHIDGKTHHMFENKDTILDISYNK